MDIESKPMWRRVARAIWNGPFYIGALTSPTSVGDVLLKILETVWRCFIAVTGLILGGVAAIFLWIEVIEPFAFPPLASKIETSVAYDDGTGPPPTNIEIPSRVTASEGGQFRCNSTYPLMLSFSNKSDEPVGRISFQVEAYSVGRTEPVSTYSPYNTSDSIIQPGYWFVQCWSTPVLPEGIDASSLIYRVQVRHAEAVNADFADSVSTPVPGSAPPALAKPSGKSETGWIKKVAAYAIAIFALIVAYVGAHCLVEVARLLAPKPVREWIAKNREVSTWLAAFVNIVLVWACSALAMSFRPIGAWLEWVDIWSRANGFDDALPLGLFAVALLWTVPVLWLLEAKVMPRP